MTAFKAGLALAGDDEGLAWQFMLALALTYDKAGEPPYAIETYQRLLEETEAHGAVLSPKWKNRRALIAQDIKKIIPQAVSDHGDNGVMGVDYSRLTAVLVEAMKAQQSEIETLKSAIAKLSK